MELLLVSLQLLQAFLLLLLLHAPLLLLKAFLLLLGTLQQELLQPHQPLLAQMGGPLHPSACGQWLSALSQPKGLDFRRMQLCVVCCGRRRW